MNSKALMQIALDSQWELLPPALKNHYGEDAKGENHATGVLTIQYPWFMQWPLNFFRLLGALVNKRGKDLKTTVAKTNKDGKQYWQREIIYPNGKKIVFNSVFVAGNNKDFIEYINSFLGLRMYAFVENNKLRYESKGYVLKLGKIKIPIAEWLALGHASIIEWQADADDEQTFDMDFRIKHPLFGEVFCYTGRFTTVKATHDK
ncbi:MAG: DUF4166 domain-containing protein [Proteobacteria bacterium]|nr:DUF4166 domain-containing protein [Pseudomonadota bacterium]